MFFISVPAIGNFKLGLAVRCTTVNSSRSVTSGMVETPLLALSSADRVYFTLAYYI